jgi:hypothetical protein
VLVGRDGLGVGESGVGVHGFVLPASGRII